VADMLDSTVESVNSALKRARASLQRRQPPTDKREPAPAPDSPPSRRSWQGSSAPTRPGISTRWSPCLRASTGIRHGTGLFVLTLIGDRICAFTRFDNSVLPWFGPPRSLPSR
jgi:hypothetical protein